MNGDKVQLRREDGHIVIIDCEGKADFIIRLLEHLDGSNTLEDLVGILDSSKEEIKPVLRLLKEKRLLKEVRRPRQRSQEDCQQQLLFFLHYINNIEDEYELQRKLRDSRVALLGMEELTWSY